MQLHVDPVPVAVVVARIPLGSRPTNGARTAVAADRAEEEKARRQGSGAGSRLGETPGTPKREHKRWRWRHNGTTKRVV